MREIKYKNSQMIYFFLPLLAVTLLACVGGTGKGRGGCSGCGDLIGSGLGESVDFLTGNSVQLGLDFYLQSGSNVKVSAQGVFYVNQLTALNNLCHIPIGQYDITTLELGTVNAVDFLRDFSLQAAGPVLIEFYIPYMSLLIADPAVVSCFGQSYPNEAVGEVFIHRVNGVDCPMSLAIAGKNQLACH